MKKCDCKECTSAEVQILRLTPTAKIPQRGSREAAGYDVFVDEPEFTLAPGETRAVGTGIAMTLPKGTLYQVCSRSGWAFKHQVLVLNAPGIIDSDYTGELKVLIHNGGQVPHKIVRGDRVAQLVFLTHWTPEFVEGALRETERGSGGFGSSGM